MIPLYVSTKEYFLQPWVKDFRWSSFGASQEFYITYIEGRKIKKSKGKKIQWGCRMKHFYVGYDSPIFKREGIHMIKYILRRFAEMIVTILSLQRQPFFT